MVKRLLIAVALGAVGAGAAVGLLLLGDDVAPTRAAFPGTNGKIAFTRNLDGNGEIYVMNADGTNAVRLTNNPAHDLYPGWSPDGTKIAFTSFRDGDTLEIYVMNADGSVTTRLTNNTAHDREGAWSPDGTKIVFYSNRDAGDWEIYVMNADGSGQTRLTNSVGIDEQPDWSPDGTMIAFSTTRDGNREIYVMNADGTDPVRLTNNPSGDEEPVWSPDGTKIAFESYRDGLGEIYIMNADGTGQANLTSNSGNDHWAAWSPDGTKIAFTSDRDGSGNEEIYVMNTDGSGQTRLTNNPTADFWPAWQPLTSTPTPTPTPTATATPTPTPTLTSTSTPPATPTPTPTIEADIDIKPGGDPNSINAASQGLIRVAILSTASFDATTVDGTTVQFGPAGALAAHDQTDSANLADHQLDVDGDGLTDYVLHFLTGLTGISEGDTEACLTGQTFGSIAIEGCDAVRIVPPSLDSDGDGFGDAVEATLTTDQFAACSIDASHNAWPADINNDGISDMTDIAELASWYGQAAPMESPRYDVEADGFVDISDIAAIDTFFGQGCAGP